MTWEFNNAFFSFFYFLYSFLLFPLFAFRNEESAYLIERSSSGVCLLKIRLSKSASLKAAFSIYMTDLGSECNWLAIWSVLIRKTAGGDLAVFLHSSSSSSSSSSSLRFPFFFFFFSSYLLLFHVCSRVIFTSVP